MSLTLFGGEEDAGDASVEVDLDVLVEDFVTSPALVVREYTLA